MSRALASLLFCLACDSNKVGVNDQDGDGIPASEDCNDTDLYASEVLTWYTDADGDGYGDASDSQEACGQPEGTVAEAGDCDDADPLRSPGVLDECDEIDNDCDDAVDEDGLVQTGYLDDDGDGYGDPDVSLSGCTLPDTYVADDSDCDDADPDVSPAGTELCNEIDDDCDGDVDNDPADVITVYADADGDGFGDPGTAALACPGAGITDGSDCDDTRDDVNPDAEEVCEDGLDNDCDGTPGDCMLWGEEALLDLGLVLGGSTAGEQTGYAVAGLGDVTGDGVPDLGVGARLHSGSAANAGAAWVASASGAGRMGIDELGLLLTGSSTNEYVGSSVSGLADLDGDGVDELLVGAPAQTSSTTSGGVAYLLLGPVSASGALADEATFALSGAALGDAAGSALAGLGDTDGDGLADAGVAADYNDDSYSGAGAAYVLTSWPEDGTGGLDEAGTILLGEQESSRLGDGLGALGDTDGDGLMDLAAGASRLTEDADRQGGAYVLLGGRSGVIDASDADGRYVGQAAGDGAGAAVGGAGDINGDGWADLLVGGTRSSFGATGATWLAFGPATGALGLGEVEAVFESVSGTDESGAIYGDFYLGCAVSAAGDVDGDGSDDLLLAAYGYTGRDGEATGAAFLVYGPVSAGTWNLDGLGEDGLDGALLRGESYGDGAGFSVAGAGDADADGFDDVLVGAYMAGDESEGAAILVSGGGW